VVFYQESVVNPNNQKSTGNSFLFDRLVFSMKQTALIHMIHKKKLEGTALFQNIFNGTKCKHKQ